MQGAQLLHDSQQAGQRKSAGSSDSGKFPSFRAQTLTRMKQISYRQITLKFDNKSYKG